MTWRILEGDCRDVLRSLPARSVHTVVTSPPYYGLRDYGTVGQLGLEATPDEYVAALVAVFGEVRRVLRDDGTVWLNLGDSYSSSPPGIKSAERYKASGLHGNPAGLCNGLLAPETADKLDTSRLPGIKPKDLLGIPWMVAFALRADGWYLRSDIIWSKPNPMPESVTDRPTKAHEYVFLLSKGPRYFYDADAIREPIVREWGEQNGSTLMAGSGHTLLTGQPTGHVRQSKPLLPDPRGANKRSVWTVATQPYVGAHFATFPPKLIEPCVLAGCPEGGTVLDPFCGAGTTGLVAAQYGRDFIGIELSPEYAALGRERVETFVRLGYRTPQGARRGDDNGQGTMFDLEGDAA